MAFIKPTVGRVVWYHPSPKDPGAQMLGPGLGVTHAATIAHVWSDSCVNLSVTDSNGNHYAKTSVLLVQGDMARPDAGYAEWMPYQVGQAAKTEEFERQLRGVDPPVPVPGSVPAFVTGTQVAHGEPIDAQRPDSKPVPDGAQTAA